MLKGKWAKEIFETVCGAVVCGTFIVVMMVAVLNFYPIPHN